MKSRLAIAAICLCLLQALSAARAESGLPKIESVAIDSHGRIAVNGQPFFPILLYDAPTDDASLAKLHEWGFNTIAITDAKRSASLPAQGFYAALHVSKPVEDLSGVVLAIGVDSPALSFPTETLAKTKAENAKALKAAPKRPVMNAMGYWADEPAGVIAGTLLSKEKYEDLLYAMDVAAPYLYPVPYQPVSNVGDAIERIKKAARGQCVLPILQLFVWDAKDRYPTPAELRAMAFESLIEGAGGIGYYSYGSITGKQKTNIAAEQPELWNSVKPLNAEIAAIASYLASAKDDAAGAQLAEKSDSIRFKAVDGLILLVNQSEKPQDVTIKFARTIKPIEKADWGKPLAAENQSAKIQLAPFEAVALRYGGE